MVKLKRLLILVISLMMISSVAYAAVDDLVVANQTNFTTSGLIKEKNNRYNYATVNITSGPTRTRDSIQVYIGNLNSTLKTETITYDMPLTKTHFYPDPFDSSKYKGEDFYAHVRIVPYSYSTRLTIRGNFTP